MRHRKLGWISQTHIVFLLVSALGCATARANPQQQSEMSARSDLIGTWRVTYTNNAVRTYEVGSDDTVRFMEENLQARVQRGEEVLLQFDDGKLERWTLAGTRLFVEHWNPASKYPQQPPTVIGIGVRVSMAQAFRQKVCEPLQDYISNSLWQWDGSSGETVYFDENGYVENSGWTARGLATRWEVVDGHTVLLRVEKGRTRDLYAILLFSDDFSNFSGFNFSGGSRLAESHRIREAKAIGQPNDKVGFQGDDGKLVIPSQRPWTDTGINVKAGQEIRLLATGTIHGCRGPKQDWAYGPWGPNGKLFKEGHHAAAGMRLFALIGKIGDRDFHVQFHVGAKATIKAAVDGRLYLGISDSYHSDNVGSFTVKVDVDQGTGFP